MNRITEKGLEFFMTVSPQIPEFGRQWQFPGSHDCLFFLRKLHPYRKRNRSTFVFRTFYSVSMLVLRLKMAVQKENYEKISVNLDSLRALIESEEN